MPVTRKENWIVLASKEHRYDREEIYDPSEAREFFQRVVDSGRYKTAVLYHSIPQEGVWERLKKHDEFEPQPFDIGATGMTFYDDMFQNPEYIASRKGYVFNIEWVTISSYFEMSAEVHDTSWSEERWMVSASRVDGYARDMQAGDVFPLCVVDRARGAQEGRHRAQAASQVGMGKIPTMVVDEV